MSLVRNPLFAWHFSRCGARNEARGNAALRAGPLPRIYDPSGTGRVLFAFFAAMAETERENIREATLEGFNAAARKENHGGRPPVITADLLRTVSVAAPAAKRSKTSARTWSSPPASAKAATQAWPASTARWPNTPSASGSPRRSSGPTGASPPSGLGRDRPRARGNPVTTPKLTQPQIAPLRAVAAGQIDNLGGHTDGGRYPKADRADFATSG